MTTDPTTIFLMFEEWADPNLGLPSYQTSGAAGADIRANFPKESRAQGLCLQPMQRALCPTGLRLEIPAGFEAQLRPRSGLALKQGLSLPNSPATIDSDYRGPLNVILINFGDTAITITHGDRIAQMVIAPVVQARFQKVEALHTTTQRQAGGFGSTGIRG